MNASSNNVRTSSATGQPSSSLRPRNRRLISGLDDGDDTTVTDSAGLLAQRRASPLPSPLDSRSASPIPSGHLSRPKRDNADARRYNAANRTGTESPTSLAALWGSSWTTLQSMASDLLSTEDPSEIKGKPAGRSRKPLSRLQNQRASTSAPPSQWGPAQLQPAPGVGIGSGTREEREAAVRAQKRKDILVAGESSYSDTLGRFKRRTSDDRTTSSAPPGDNENRNALAYLHHVQKSDTLAGITIKYNISANILRKANRMWPNDTVQARKTLVLPVDACGVKGKPVDGPESIDLLGEESAALSAGQAEEVPSLANGLPDGASDTRTRTNSTSTTTTHHTDPSTSAENPWHHDSWSLLPTSNTPTEIVRLARRTLGYFPPARRKSQSQSHSDLDTPSASLDLIRTSSSLSSQPPTSSPQRPRGNRRPSNATNGYYPSYLSGPGGVGTFNRNVRAPGPAQDGLNKMFAPHLPDVAPPRNQNTLYQPEMPLYSDLTPGASGASTPVAGANMQLDFTHIGGAVEGWARKWAGKAGKGLLSPGGPTSAARRGFSSPFVSTPGRAGVAGAGVGAGHEPPWGDLPGGASGVSDLIEMTDEFEIGEDEEDEGRGRVSNVRPTMSGKDYFGGADFQARPKGGKRD